ncbi:efflux RND transporter periplasmic adaptor subunit [Verrucomicrobiaceae bacterium 227]
MAKILRLLLPALLLGFGYLGYKQLSAKKESATKIKRERRIIETEALLLERTDFRVSLTSEGVVQSHNETGLTPRVNGRIIKIAPEFESGSFFGEGTVLIELDPSDFEAELSASEARLARAEASLAQEAARAEQALLDWKDLGYTEEPTDLVLRKPQLKEAHANVKAAIADLSDARRNLERTKVIAPYAGRVKSRLVGLGQSVSSGTTLGEIFSTDFAEIRLSLSARELDHIELPNNPGDAPIPVTFTDALSDFAPQSWEGSIVRTEGTLDEKSRKLFVIARVDDPFGLKTKTSAPLRIGQPVRALLQGGIIPDVFIIPRTALRRPNEVTLIHPQEFTLLRQRIDPIWRDEDNLIVKDDITEGWHLVTSRLSSIPDGAKVQIVIPEEEASQTAASSEQAGPQS